MALYDLGVMLLTAALRSVFLVAALLPAPALAAAGDAAGGTEDAGSSGFWEHLTETPRLLGDPDHIRTRLSDLGLTLELFGNYFFGALLRGGRQDDGSRGHSGSFDFFAHGDLEELGVLPGAEILFHAKSNRGRNVNPEVGALSQPFDDADFDKTLYVAELWFQQDLLDDRLRLRAGYVDSQVDFDRNAYANSEDRQFMSAFLDNNPIVPLKVGLGATLIANPAPRLSLVLGTADADNDVADAGFDTAFDSAASLMGYFEVDLAVEVPGRRGPLAGSYRVGVFYDGRRRTEFGSKDGVSGSADRDRGHVGAYVSCNQLAFRESSRDRQGLGLFARFGYADDDVNRIAWFWSAGAQYLGLLPHREEDVVGLGIYAAIGSSRYRHAVDRRAGDELGVELYYRVQATPWLTITPDIQLVHNPGASTSVGDALILGLRVRATF